MMNLVTVNLISTKKEYIINKCISHNVEVYTAETPTDIHKILTSKNITHIFIDLMSKNHDWLAFLKELKKSEEGSKYQIIINSNRKEKEFIQQLLYMGIVGFIPSDLGFEATFEKLDKIMKITEKRDIRRKHFRVSVPVEDEILLNFKMPNQDNLIKGRVTDLSIVAIAFKLDTPGDYKNYGEGSVVEKVQLKINKKFSLISIKILKAGPVTVGMFVETSENATNVISQYIFKAMQKGIEKPEPVKEAE
jgi:response regulator of citrate/malate metabolism